MRSFCEKVGREAKPGTILPAAEAEAIEAAATRIGKIFFMRLKIGLNVGWEMVINCV
jgi:hypothetical protein